MQTGQLLTLADASVGQTSVPFRLGDIQNYSIQVQFVGGALAGTLTLEADNIGVVVPGGTPAWTTVQGSAQVVAAGAGHIWDVSVANYGEVRVKWVPTGGAGTITVFYILKEAGLNRN